MAKKHERREFLHLLSMTALGTALYSGGIISGLSLLTRTAQAQSSSAPTPVAQEEALQGASMAEVQALIDNFVGDKKVIDEGLRMIMDPLASNPSSIPIKAVLDEEMSESNYCEELIFITEGNPIPLACRFKFTPLAGTTEVSFRTRLIDAQYIRALARMNDGRILSARRYVTVVAGACGM